MKTIAKILIATAVLLFAAQINAFSANWGGPRPTVNHIQYAVVINASQLLPGAGNLNLFVMVTDEHGKQIAPVQPFRPGISTYYFNELGPVIGTRVASMVLNQIEPATVHFYCAPDSRTGKFVNGATYFFNLVPTIKPPKID